MYLVCSVCIVEAHDGLLRVCDGLDASQSLWQLPVHVVQAAHRVRPEDDEDEDEGDDLLPIQLLIIFIILINILLLIIKIILIILIIFW